MPSDEDYERLLDNASDSKDRLILYVLGEGGFRAKEFLSIREPWLEDGDVRIPLADPATAFTAKTSAASRVVPLKDMSRAAWDVLADWVEGNGGIGMCHGTLWLRVRNAGRRAELPKKLFPHALRARCASYWAYRIDNIYDFMELFGWSTPKIAMLYVKQTGVRGKTAVRKAKLNMA